MSTKVYLSPKAEGPTGGATPAGPATAPAASAPAGDCAGPGAHPDRRTEPMTNFLLDIWSDLREKRLWPVAVALLVALVAVPVVLSKPAEEAEPRRADVGRHAARPRGHGAASCCRPTSRPPSRCCRPRP